MRRDRDIDSLDQGKSCDQGQRRRRRIVAAQLDDRASVEIAGRGDPFASLAATAGNLLPSDKPVPFDGSRIRYEVGVRRAGAFDDANAAQKRLLAALSVSELKGPMSK